MTTVDAQVFLYLLETVRMINRMMAAVLVGMKGLATVGFAG